MENSLSNGFHTGSLDPKAHRLYQMQERVGTLPESETLLETTFMSSAYLANAGAGRILEFSL